MEDVSDAHRLIYGANKAETLFRKCATDIQESQRSMRLCTGTELNGSLLLTSYYTQGVWRLSLVHLLL